MSDEAQVMGQMETIGTLPDGRTLYHAGEHFTEPGFYVTDPEKPGHHLRVELIFARGTEAGRAEPAPPQRPTIGRMVHYFGAANGEPGEISQPKAAIVVGVRDNEGDFEIGDEMGAHLLVFDSFEHEGQLRHDVPFSALTPRTLDVACWRWPERV